MLFRSDAGQLTDLHDNRRGDINYRYDPLGRLLGASSQHKEETFAFDPASNLLDEKNQQAQRPLDHDPKRNTLMDNLLREYAGSHYDYDERGNQIRRWHNGQQSRLHWDLFDRLVRFENSQLSVDYAYDPLGRRLYKETAGKKTWFGWDGDALALDVAKAQLAVAQEFQAAGKDPRHHAAAIMQEGQQRAFAGLAQQSQAKAEPERPAAVQVSEQDRKRAEMYAKREADQFKALAVKRQAGFAGYSDRNPSAWRELPPELRERIERFNAMPKERQAVELDKMQRELADRYARDPKEIERSRQRQREQERGNGGLSR